MPRNIEVKVAVPDPAAVRARARTIADGPPEPERQVDTYYSVDPTGASRVKVRDSDRYGLQLIRYHRPEAEDVRPSEYTRDLLSGPDDPRLAELGDSILVVDKRREVLWVENVRVHLDRVEGLGDFLELEAVVDADHDDASCRASVDRILAELGLAEQPAITASYSDLLADEA
jgi:predicted adenylyl cyclase CyaB